jgi:hypothetical protein
LHELYRLFEGGFKCLPPSELLKPIYLHPARPCL